MDENIYFYILLGVFIYFIFTRHFENFNINENFSKSLQASPINLNDQEMNIPKNNIVFSEPIDPCAYYKIRGFGYKVPLYYGWNVLWPDNTWTEFLRTNVTWNGSTSDKYINNNGVNLVNTCQKDSDCSARYVAVKPGYKISTYAYTSNLTMTYMETIYPGEYLFDDLKYMNDSGSNYIVYIIAVQNINDNFGLPDYISPI